MMRKHWTLSIMICIGTWKLGIDKALAMGLVPILLWEMPYLRYTTGPYADIYDAIYEARLSHQQRHIAQQVKDLGWIYTSLTGLLLAIYTDSVSCAYYHIYAIGMSIFISVATMIYYYFIIAITL